MGQRSQIYVRIDGELVIANYYQWNYGESMICRARYGMESIKDMFDHGLTISNNFIEKLRRLFDVNFDYHDLAISIDLLNDPHEDPDLVFAQDNNDGKLLVAVETKWGGEIKYAFTDSDGKFVFTPEAYLKWDKDDPLFPEKCQDNMAWINQNAKLMTKKEAEEFQREGGNHD